MHIDLTGFDYANGIYYYNVGEGSARNWDDYLEFRFISAGQGARWRDAMLGFQSGDIIAAYLKRHGFVGIGVIEDRARPIRDVTVEGKPLLTHALRAENMSANAESDELCEYVCAVEWLRAGSRAEAKWKSRAGLYTTTHVRASLDGQTATIEFLEQAFDIDLREHVK